MVRLATISYGKTFNLGNYEAERLQLELDVSDREYTDTEINQLYVALKKRLHELQKEG